MDFLAKKREIKAKSERRMQWNENNAIYILRQRNDRETEKRIIKTVKL